MRFASFICSLHVLLSFSCRNAHGIRTNLTVDDTDSAYWTFTGDWNALSPSSSCSRCVVKPNPALAYNNTWHDGTLVSGTFTFQGSAVFIYGIDFPSPDGGTAAGSSVTFQMDTPSRTRFHTYTGTEYVYNSLFFAATDLDSSTTHAVNWVIQGSSSTGQAALFDYAQVTVGEDKAVPPPVSKLFSNAGGELNTKSSTSLSHSGVTASGSTTSPSSSEQTVTTSFPGSSDSGGAENTVAPGSSSVSAPHKSDTVHHEIVVGAVVGVLCTLALLIALGLVLLRSTSRLALAGPGWQVLRRQAAPDAIEPFLLSQSDVSIPISHSEKLNSESQQHTSPSTTSNVPQALPPSTDPSVLAVDREVEERLRNLLRVVAAFPPAYS